ncbi:unnamed protein product [Gulo gulo]|uniref:Uncharacterized protein n=1 Tax=Gulo gulo TaxID=48420 RepID=A0A9X9Q4W5_GULGU|nr:unnamed protein product [Gulo gulo]
MSMHVSVCGPSLPDPLAILPRLLSPSVLPTSPGSVPRPQWAGVIERSPSPLWVTHWEAGRRGSCLPQPRTHPSCAESPGRMSWPGTLLPRP